VIASPMAPQDRGALRTLQDLVDQIPFGWVLVTALAVGVVVHVVLAIVVFVHARARVEELQYWGRWGWTLVVLSSGVFAAIAYWIIHARAASKDGGRPGSE